MTEEHCRRCPSMNFITGPTLTKEMPQMMKCISMRAWTQTTSSLTNTQGRWISLSSNIITVRVTKLNNRLRPKGPVLYAMELLSNQSPRTFMPENRARRSWAAPMLIVFWTRATRPLSQEVPHQDSRATLKSRNRESPTLAESATFTSKCPRVANFLVDIDPKRYFNIPILFKRRPVTLLCISHWVPEHQASRMVSVLFLMLLWMAHLRRTSNLLSSPTETVKTNIRVLENQARSKTSRHSRWFLIRNINLLPREPTRRVFIWMTMPKTSTSAVSRESHLSESKAHPSTSRKSNRLWLAPLLQKHSLQLCIRKRIFNRTFWTQTSPWTFTTSLKRREAWLTLSPSISCTLLATCQEKLPPTSKGKTLIANTTWLKTLTDTWGNLKKPTMSLAAWIDIRSHQLWEPEWSTGWLKS